MSDTDMASLPDLQPLVDRLEELAQGDGFDLLGQVGDQLGAIKAAEDALSSLQQQAGELLSVVESFKAARESSAQDLQAVGHELSGESESWLSGTKDADRALQDAGAKLRSALGDATARAGERVDQLRQVALGQWHGEHLSRLGESGRRIDDTAKAAQAHAENLGNTLVAQASDGLQQLGRGLLEDMGERIERQAARRFADEAARMGGEVANNLVLSQASIAITGAVTPILPQLIALKAAVGAIKLALHPFG